MSARVLVVGSGGREHALAWKLERSPEVESVFVAPGNDAFSPAWERWPVDLSQGRSEFEKLARRAREAGVTLAVIGPDNPLADGIVDAFEAAGVPAFGPSAAAAQIEASKAFSKQLMREAGVPTATFRIAENAQEARALLKSLPWPGPGPGAGHAGHGWVVKADGLALGKGVRVCTQLSEALPAAEELIGVSGRLVIEERLIGEEISWMAFCDGETCSLLEPARDYKPLNEGNTGPNTGGMGAFSPVPGLPESLAKEVEAQVFTPVLAAMKKRGTPFRGLLYAGLMWNPESGKFWVLEFNARFGDPETQVLLPRMEDELYAWCLASTQGRLSKMPRRVPFKSDAAVVVVAAAPGYPEKPRKGLPVQGLAAAMGREDEAGQATYFVAGVKKPASMAEGEYVTSGGRVLGAVGVASTLEGAREDAYNRLSRVKFEGMHFRKDIGEVRASQNGGAR